MSHYRSILLLVIAVINNIQCYNNGVARTPPMGWLSWERFRCNTDCVDNPDSCISEKLYKDMADRLHEDGWSKHGYTIVHIDDCWSSHDRTAENELQPDPKRFPHGMKALADYVHSKGLKLGIYGDMGSETCSGFPGTMGYEKIDAQTFARWGIDMLKLDGCNSNVTQKEVGYPLMSKELNATGRHIIYSCSWPINLGGLPPKVNYTLLGEICNVWRNYNDIGDDFEDVVKIINWYGDHQDVLIPAAGPGKWNDPDMLIGGDFSLSYDESKLQFGIWAMLAAPLLVSVDLRTIDPKIRDNVYFNDRVIAVNQDPLGHQGRRVNLGGRHGFWVKPLVGGNVAIAIIDVYADGTPLDYKFSIKQLGIKDLAPHYLLEDLFDEESSKYYSSNEIVHVDVNPHGIRMFRATPSYISPSLVSQVKVGIELDIL